MIRILIADDHTLMRDGLKQILAKDGDLVVAGEELLLHEKMHQNTMVLEARNVAQSQNVVPWLEIDREHARARVVALPKRENVQTPPINEQLIVELYSK